MAQAVQRQRERWRSRSPARFPREESRSRETSNQKVTPGFAGLPLKVEFDRGSTYGRQIFQAHAAEAEQCVPFLSLN